jgi:hypothetical protein
MFRCDIIFIIISFYLGRPWPSTSSRLKYIIFQGLLREIRTYLNAKCEVVTHATVNLIFGMYCVLPCAIAAPNTGRAPPSPKPAGVIYGRPLNVRIFSVWNLSSKSIWRSPKCFEKVSSGGRNVTRSCAPQVRDAAPPGLE